jgi:16S rRNA (cytosine967-C5)-methyltransferase
LKAQESTPPRARVAQVLLNVINDGASLDRELDAARRLTPDPRNQALIQECAYGVLRHYYSLRRHLSQLIERPLRKRDAVIEMLLLSGLYQLFEMQVPEHAVVDASAAAVRSLDKSWASGLVNATLRNALRQRERFVPPTTDDAEACWNHPRWLIDTIRAAWPDDWQRVMQAATARPPFTLRVNRRQLARDEYLVRLQDADLAARALAHCPDGIVLESAVPVSSLPGFDAGLVSVQDGAAQLAAPLLDAQPGQRVLDACAAPGGKTMHLLETVDALELTALDIDPVRLARVNQSAARLGLQCRVIAGDAALPAPWWDGTLYDRILLDAPCSATGVIRRHPDIKLHRAPDDLALLPARQAAIFDGLWPLLRPGGKLLYATCSILPQENDDVLSAALQRHRDALAAPINVAWGRPTRHGRQILSGEHDMDGFYFCVIEKAAHD